MKHSPIELQPQEPARRSGSGIPIRHSAIVIRHFFSPRLPPDPLTPRHRPTPDPFPARRGEKQISSSQLDFISWTQCVRRFRSVGESESRRVGESESRSVCLATDARGLKVEIRMAAHGPRGSRKSAAGSPVAAGRSRKMAGGLGGGVSASQERAGSSGETNFFAQKATSRSPAAVFGSPKMAAGSLETLSCILKMAIFAHLAADLL